MQQTKPPETVKVDLRRIPNQRAFVISDDRYPSAIGGIGSAKTTSGLFKALLYHDKHPLADGIITAPTYPMLWSATMPVISRWCGNTGLIRQIVRGSDNARIEWASGSVAYLRTTTSPENLRGPEVAWVWMDEQPMSPEEAFVILQGRIRQQGYPHQLWGTGSPRGYNWIWRNLVQRPIAGARKFQMRTVDNCFNDPDYYADLQRQYQGQWARQELEGEFVAFEGLVYATFSEATHVRTPPALSEFVQVWGGLDFGISSPTVILILGVDRAGRYWLIREYYKRRAEMAEVLQTATEWQQECHVTRFWADPAGDQEIAFLRAGGLRVDPAPIKDIDLGIRLVQNRLATVGGLPGFMISPECPWTKTEFMGYSFRSSINAQSLEEKFADKIATGQADHAMDTIRYIICALETRVSGSPNVKAGFAPLGMEWRR